MLERRLEQMEALLQTTKGHNLSGNFNDSNPYRQMQSLPSPEFHRHSQPPVVSYPSNDHPSYRSPEGSSISQKSAVKKSFHDPIRNQAMTSIETPRSIMCSPPSTATQQSVEPLPNISYHAEGPLSPATTRAPIDKEECILSPDNVLSLPSALCIAKILYIGELGAPR